MHQEVGGLDCARGIRVKEVVTEAVMAEKVVSSLAVSQHWLLWQRRWGMKTMSRGLLSYMDYSWRGPLISLRLGERLGEGSKEREEGRQRGAKERKASPAVFPERQEDSPHTFGTPLDLRIPLLNCEHTSAKCIPSPVCCHPLPFYFLFCFFFFFSFFLYACSQP